MGHSSGVYGLDAKELCLGIEALTKLKGGIMFTKIKKVLNNVKEVVYKYYIYLLFIVSTSGALYFYFNLHWITRLNLTENEAFDLMIISSLSFDIIFLRRKHGWKD